MNNKREGDWMSVVGIILFLAFLFFVGTCGIFWGRDSKKPQPAPCVNSSREEQVITKLEGDVVSVETEIVFGSECGGVFYPAP